MSATPGTNFKIYPNTTASALSNQGPDIVVSSASVPSTGEVLTFIGDNQADWGLVTSSINGLTGAITIAGGSGISIVSAVHTITISNIGVLSIEANGGTAHAGTINFVNGTNTTVVDNGGGSFQINVPAGAGGISSINGSTGAITITNGSGISVGTVGTTITVGNTGVLSVEANSGTAHAGIINFVNGTNTTVVDNGGGSFQINVPAGAGGISSINGSTGAITITNGSGISVGTVGTTITVGNTGVLSNIAGTGISVSGATGNVTIGNTGVTSVNTLTGAITLAAGGTTTITPSGQTLTISSGFVYTTASVTFTYEGLNFPATVNFAKNGNVALISMPSLVLTGTTGTGSVAVVFPMASFPAGYLPTYAQSIGGIMLTQSSGRNFPAIISLVPTGSGEIFYPQPIDFTVVADVVTSILYGSTNPNFPNPTGDYTINGFTIMYFV